MDSYMELEEVVSPARRAPPRAPWFLFFVLVAFLLISLSCLVLEGWRIDFGCTGVDVGCPLALHFEWSGKARFVHGKCPVPWNYYCFVCCRRHVGVSVEASHVLVPCIAVLIARILCITCTDTLWI